MPLGLLRHERAESHLRPRHRAITGTDQYFRWQ